MASTLPAAAPDASTELPADAQVPYLLTTRPNGFLPDMTGFEPQRVGSLARGWHSLCPIKAGRDLMPNEKLTACLVRRKDGALSTVTFTATAGTLDKAKWPVAFAKAIATASSARVPMTAGNWTGENQFSQDVDPLRVWSHTAEYRAYTTAPFGNNLVQALAFNDRFALKAGQTLCLQVRDTLTQHLYETHFFPQKADGLGRRR
ncbi:hypothetical protein D3C77_329860 [compost metagenome]